MGLAQDWVQVSSLPASYQTDHTFGFALGDKGYVVAGRTNSGVKSDFYSYDALDDEWTKLDDFPGGPRGFSIGDTWDGKAYFGFGVDEFERKNDLWVFDPLNETWTELASCPCAPRTHPAMVAIGGKVYVGLGGGEFGNLGDWWAYDIELNTWEELADFPAAERHHPFQFGIGDFVYVGFGHGDGFISRRWYQYDPLNDSWAEVASIPAEGRVAGTQFSFNGKGYILSGDGQDHRSMESGEFWSYDPAIDSWEELPPHPDFSRWAPASFVLNGEVYLINGPNTDVSPIQYRDEIYKFDLVGMSDVDDVNFISTRALQVRPNPTNLLLQLNVQDDAIDQFHDYRIVNLDGRVVSSGKLNDQSIDVSGLPASLYFIDISNDEAILSAKFLKL